MCPGRNLKKYLNELHSFFPTVFHVSIPPFVCLPHVQGQNWCQEGEVFSLNAEFLKHTDTHTHVRAEFSIFCAFFLLLNTKLAK